MRQRIILFVAIIALVLSMVSCEPSSTRSDNQANSGGGPAWNAEWDSPFGTPQYLVHATGHGTVNGPVTDDWYFLFPNPPTDGKLELPDGMGGTFTYSIDYSAGPYNTPSAVCAAVPSAAAEGTFTAWNHNFSFSCKDVNAARNNRGNPQIGDANDGNNDNGGNNGGNNGGGNGNNGGGAQANLSAWTTCSGFVELNPDEVSQICDVCVLDWISNTSSPVEVQVSPPDGIIVAPGNTSNVPGNMFNPGVSDHQEYCFSEFWRAEGIPAGQYNVPIVVSQAGAGTINLSVLAQVPESGFPFGVCPTFRTLAITADGWAANDWISAQGYGADGRADLFANVTVTVDDPQAYITDFEMQVTDVNGYAITDPWMAWSTTPSEMKGFLGVYSPLTNQWLNDPSRNWGIEAAMGGTTANFQLMASGTYDWLYANQFRLLVTVYFGYNAGCTAAAIR